MPFTPKLTYKGKPLVRKDNELYYGCMTDPYVLYLQIQSTKTVGGVDVADKVHLQLLSTDESSPVRPAWPVRPPRTACTMRWTSAASGCRRQTRTSEPKSQAAERGCPQGAAPFLLHEYFAFCGTL